MEYMRFAARLSSLKFGSDSEMLKFKSDFTAALAFIKKLDDVNTDGVEPLGNVLEFYGGNSEHMQSVSTVDESQSFSQSEFCSLNRHAAKNKTYSVLPINTNEEDE